MKSGPVWSGLRESLLNQRTSERTKEKAMNAAEKRKLLARTADGTADPGAYLSDGGDWGVGRGKGARVGG